VERAFKRARRAAASGVRMEALDELALLLKPAGGGLYLVSTGKAEQQALQRRFYGADGDEDVTRAFRAALARVRDAKVVVLGVPSDVGAGFRRGANLGPMAIRQRLLQDDPGFPEWAQGAGVVDVGDVFVVPQLLDDDMLSADQLRRSRDALYPDVDAAARAVLPVSPLSIARRALDLLLQLNPNVKPFVLGGDHSVAWPVVSALHAARRDFAIVQPDAHTDLLEHRLGVRICFATWSWHANELLGRGGRMIQVGTRATRFPRAHWEQTLDVKQFWAEDVLRDPRAALDGIVDAVRASGARGVYFSNDIDGTDAAHADATGTPEPGGLSPEFLLELVERLGREVGLVGADLVEVAPPLGPDSGERTLSVAARYARASLAALLA
jgi:arginase family enzyme